ncbi:MAG: PEP-utilizing enzyme [Acidimicrobiia bacterium]
MFDELWTAAQVIGLADSFPDGRFPAGIDPAGDLHIDPDGIAAMQRAFPTRPDPAFLARLERTRAERCRGLLDQVAAAEDAAGAGDAGALAAAVTRLLEAVAMVMPYPVLTKIVPGLLLAAMAEDGDTEPPLPEHPSPGTRLTRGLGRLASWCASRGHPPATLLDGWPPPDPEVVEAVRSFCRDHAGFGPVAWEAPGFDSPQHALRAMATFDPGDTPPSPPGPVDFAPSHGDQAVTLRAVAVRWVEYLDLQIWYVRHAFYRGLVPLLSRLGEALGVAPWRLLFVERAEFAAAIPPADEIDRRIVTYLGRADYLAAAGVDLPRLHAIFGRGDETAPVPAGTAAVGPGVGLGEVMIGTGAAPGTAVGPAFVLTTDGDLAGAPPGSVLVARVLHPYFAPALPRVSAVIVEEGGLLQHATVLAREFGIPAVVAVGGATRLIATGTWLEVDGRSGRVTVLAPAADA